MLEAYLKARLQHKSLLLMTHMVLGYPSFQANWEMLEVMEEADVEVVELQFPFSEPVADGPLFVMANQASLDAGTTVDQCFEFMKKASARFKMPLLMMGYYNTVFTLGEEKFCQRLAECGGKGAIVPDLPLEYAQDFLLLARKSNLSIVQIVTPNSSRERQAELARASSGFVYCVARKGVTGRQTSFDQNMENYLSDMRACTSLPVALGFGVKSREDLLQIEGKAHMAIIGTAGLQAWKDGGAAGLKKLLQWRTG